MKLGGKRLSNDVHARAHMYGGYAFRNSGYAFSNGGYATTANTPTGTAKTPANAIANTRLRRIRLHERRIRLLARRIRDNGGYACTNGGYDKRCSCVFATTADTPPGTADTPSGTADTRQRRMRLQERRTRRRMQLRTREGVKKSGNVASGRYKKMDPNIYRHLLLHHTLPLHSPPPESTKFQIRRKTTWAAFWARGLQGHLQVSQEATQS